jgi:SAM-dependent methyltransferase
MIRPRHPAYAFFAAGVQAMAAGATVIDVGTSRRFAKELAPFREVLGRRYRALGYRPTIVAPDTCDISGDILRLPFATGAVDGLICLEVLEHVVDPFAAIAELHRVLAPGGRLLLSVPFLTGYHGKSAGQDDASHDGYPDFWRFTHQGLGRLCRAFAEVVIEPVGGPLDCRLSFLGLHRFGWYHSRLVQGLLARLDRPALGRLTIRHLVLARK